MNKKIVSDSLITLAGVLASGLAVYSIFKMLKKQQPISGPVNIQQHLITPPTQQYNSIPQSPATPQQSYNDLDQIIAALRRAAATEDDLTVSQVVQSVYIPEYYQAARNAVPSGTAPFAPRNALITAGILEEVKNSQEYSGPRQDAYAVEGGLLVYIIRWEDGSIRVAITNPAPDHSQAHRISSPQVYNHDTLDDVINVLGMSVESGKVDYSLLSQVWIHGTQMPTTIQGVNALIRVLEQHVRHRLTNQADQSFFIGSNLRIQIKIQEGEMLIGLY